MNEIKCPNCGEVFTVNESQYAELLSQVRTAEFDKELHDRMKQELALAEQKAMNEQQTKNWLRRIKKLRNYRVRSKTLIQKKNWPRKRLNRQAMRLSWLRTRKYSS